MLIPLDALDGQDRLLVDQLPVTLGRGPSADLWLSDPWISRTHCELYELEGKPVIRDLDSRNGTFLNGHAVHEAVLLPEDLLRLGMTRFLVAYASPLQEPKKGTSLIFAAHKQRTVGSLRQNQ